MGTPKAHLPPPIVDAAISSLLRSIGFPLPLSIRSLDSAAEYHSIYVLTFNSAALWGTIALSNGSPPPSNGNGFVNGRGEATKQVEECILRVSGNHIPRIKTQNEAAILQWLAENTDIPVAKVLHVDETEDNPLGREYMLMTRLPGRSVADVYDDLSAEQMDHVIDQLTDVLVALYQHPFSHFGGLKFGGEERGIVRGPAVEETFWQLPDIAAFWPSTESFNTLNIDSPDGYPSFVEYMSAHLRKYVHAIEVHPSLAWLRDEGVPLVQSCIARINTPPLAERLNEVPLVLAHRDLHFGNVLIDPVTYKVTGILDWEFAQAVPLPMWNTPGRPFLWNTRSDEDGESLREKYRLYRVWEKRAREREDTKEMLEKMRWTPEQEMLYVVWTYLRSVVEVCPRGQKQKESRQWWEEAKRAMEGLEEDY
ncbi:kinase-like protein [Schizopora paradoxa]|uniref:Kinase-like protein n=1 Tax=Schizopora paradoxa TaxID=27342 RepID=A0A0H2RPD4_9AGAM|nr:kinase-like protein [Schizopora paradoxa]